MRLLAAILIALATYACADARPRGASAFSSNGGMLMNVASIGYGSGYNIFLNWWKTGSTMTLVSSINGTLIGRPIWDCPTECGTARTYFDASTGDLINPVPADVVSIARGFFAQVLYPQYQYAGTSFTNFAGQVWNVTWDGCATPTVTTSGSLGTGGTSSFGSNSGTITFGSSGYTNVGLLFTLTAPCYTDPPRNFKVFKSQFATRVANGELLDPDWVASMQPSTPFAFLRFMDMMNTNVSSISEASQIADNSFNSLNRPLENAVGFGSVSGSTLTISSFAHGMPFKAGQRIVCPGCTNTVTISSQSSGTPGGAGVYALSGAGGTAGGGTVILGILPSTGNGDWGPKGGVAPSVACEVATRTNANIEYPIPVAASNTFMTTVATQFASCLRSDLKVKFSYGNENWNSGFDTYRYVQAQATADYTGYRFAELMEIVAGVFGTSSYDPVRAPTSRWLGGIGSQYATPSVGSSAIAGAQAWITSSPSPLTLTQLVSTVDVAPYWGNFYNGSNITGISAATTPTITASNSFTNGQIVRLFVKGGTMAAVLNNIDVTVSSATGSNFVATPFNGSVVDTTGLTYGGSGNGAMDATIFRLADRSTTLNGSTPATYPTKFAYFNQQMSLAILNGSATDASYGTITVPSALNLTAAGSVPLFQQNALVAQANGLDLAQYEGGPTNTLVGNAQSPIVPTQAVEFLNMWLYDAGVTGDAINTSANLYYTMFRQFDAVNGIYPAQYNDLQQISQFGPWGALRFPGDSNPRWSAVTAQNALGRWVDPTPAPTWTLNDTAGDINFGSGGSTTLTCPITVPADGLAVIGVGWNNNTTTITSVSISGGIGNMTQDAATVNTWSSSVYSKAVLASGSPYTATITWNGSTSFRNCKSVVLSNLASGTKLSASSGNPQKSTTVNVTKGAFIFATATLSGAITFATSSTQGAATGTVTQVDKQVPAGQAFGYAYWSPGPSFSSPLFGVATNAANSLAVATYK